MKSNMRSTQTKPLEDTTKKKLEEKMKIVLPPHTSSLLKALALGQQEWFMQLCKGKNAVPKIQVNN